ncbi:MAG: trypsin-like serine protease [Hyphomicrobiales bacterium]|nr:trypsin-like serine protease [Hyphomicrobiales bacterium]
MKKWAGVMLGCTLIAPQASAIVGGQAGGPLEASAVMVLDDRGGMCSGVVIAQDVVLTAAFCVPAGAPIRVLFREAGQPVLIASQRVALHPEYRANAVQERTRSIDMALIRLQRPLPARFEPALLSTETSPTAANITAAGFGVAREGDASTIGSWRSVTLQAVEPHGPSPVLLWARGAAGAGICGGDGGGPITDTRNRVVAIANWSTGASGRSCGDLTQGPFLGPQRSWIDSILSGWGQRALWDSTDMNPQTTLGEPRPVRSIPVRPDGTIAPSPGSAPSAASVQGGVARIGYNPAGEVVVRVSGVLTRDALARFQQAIGDEKHVVVVLEGPGGNLSTGIEIGNRIRLRGYRTAVAPGTVCASACAIAWLGGARRHLDPSSRVGFHAAYIDENGRQIESGVANALVGSYANRLGLTDSAVIFITSAGPQEMNWIQTGSMNAYGVEFSTDSARYIALR